VRAFTVDDSIALGAAAVWIRAIADYPAATARGTDSIAQRTRTIFALDVSALSAFKNHFQ
jgi:hypothetical protein